MNSCSFLICSRFKYSSLCKARMLVHDRAARKEENVTGHLEDKLRIHFAHELKPDHGGQVDVTPSQ